MTARRVLIVSYFFPPFRTVGGLRISKHTKFLPAFGWEPRILTADWNDGQPDLPLYVPESSIARVPQAFDITRLPRTLLGGRRASMPPERQSLLRRRLMWAESAYRQLLCIPDAQIGWRRPAIAEGLRLIDKWRPSIIFSSSLPNTSHLVASELAKASGLPWVAELRDLWSANHNFRRVQPIRAVERAWERRVLRRADAIVTVTKPWADSLSASIGKPVRVVPNGFDPDDYPAPSEGNGSRFTLAFTGMVYQGRQSARALFQAIRELSVSGEITPENFRVTFTGHGLMPIIEEIRSEKVEAFARVQPAVSHQESLALQVDATALLFLDWLSPEGHGWHSAKIYEYAGAHRPVLSIGPADSAVAQLIAEAGIGSVAATKVQIVRVLTEWLSEWQKTGRVRYAPAGQNRESLDRRSAVRKLAAIFDEVAP